MARDVDEPGESAAGVAVLRFQAAHVRLTVDLGARPGRRGCHLVEPSGHRGHGKSQMSLAAPRLDVAFLQVRSTLKGRIAAALSLVPGRGRRDLMAWWRADRRARTG